MHLMSIYLWYLQELSVPLSNYVKKFPNPSKLHPFESALLQLTVSQGAYMCVCICVCVHVFLLHVCVSVLLLIQFLRPPSNTPPLLHQALVHCIYCKHHCFAEDILELVQF